MKILITNDDGIMSPVLPLLAKWAQKLGEVTVAAPKVEQSGKSQAINFTREIEITKVEIAPDLIGYAVDSTPADCVRFGVHGLKQKYDLILSGINRGYNLGDDIVYSGTCGAIFEGSRMGINGLAISADIDKLMEASNYLDVIWDYIQKNSLYEYNMLYNVNIPPCPNEIRITKQGGIYYNDTFIHSNGNMYVQSGDIWQDSGNDPSTDINAIRQNAVSITPLIASRTEMNVFNKLKSL
ncbi:MAG: 5'/3'-nucleotidase SurE, partial [Clostridia bacterium]|nr:5'/3'-nucleotidase SurE [Clostridia bacterium]